MTLRALRVVAGICAVLMVILVFEAVQADVPDTGANEFNHALARHGAVADASGWLGTNPPSLAIDGAASTYWKNSQYTGSIQVTFPAKAYINEVHAHFLSVKYPSLSLYFDTNGNGQYEAVEKVWSTTTNGVLDVKITTSTYYTLGMRLTIDAKVGKNLAQIAEFEAYLRYDTDGDGLTNQQETSTVYFQDMKPAGFPRSIPDDGSNATASATSLAAFAGVPVSALANFTVDHPIKAQLTAAVGYWNGSAWVDRFIWDPGGQTGGQEGPGPTPLNATGGTSAPSAVLGLRTAEWSSGETDTGTVATVVVNLTGAKALATPAETAAGIIRPEFPADSFQTYLQWRLLVQDRVLGTAGSLISFVLRFESHSDAAKADTDGDGIGEAVELNTYGTLPVAADSDLDGLPDGYEVAPHTLTITGGSRTTISFAGTWGGSQGLSLGPSKSLILGNVSGVQGDLFVLAFGVAKDAGVMESVTDDVGSAWTRVVNVSNSGNVHLEIWTAFNAGPTRAIYVKPSAANLKITIILTQYAGVGSVGATGTGTGYGVTPAATARTTQPNAWVVGETAAQGTRLPAAANGTLRASVATSGSAASSNVGGAASDILVITPRDQQVKYSLGGSENWVAAAVELDPAPRPDSVIVLPAFTTDPTKWDTDGDGLSDGQERGNVSMGQTKVVGEVGVARNVGDGWTTVYLRNKYTTPVVIAEPTTSRDPAFNHARIRAVSDHTFQIKVERWAGSGAAEDVSYLVLEAGDHVLPDGTIVEAGTASIGTTVSSIFFRERFSSLPLILVQTQTTNDGSPVIAKRTSFLSATAFGAYLNANGTAHGAEAIGYVAVTPQVDPNVLATWTRAERTFSTPTAAWAFPSNFTAPPLVLAWMAGELSGGDKNIGLRLTAVTNASASIYREQVGSGAMDVIDFFAFAGPTNLTARMTTDPLRVDTDRDSLADGLEVNTYGSNPTSRDTDRDSIPDNIEVSDRTITIPVNGAIGTFTFKTSPTSDDTDADGLKDPDELAGVLDHRNLFLDMATRTGSGDLQDLSGNGGAGNVAGATCTGTIQGRVGSACSFGGSSARLVVPDSDALDFDLSFTLMAWVQPTTTAQPEGAGILAKGVSGTEAFAMDVSGGAFRAVATANGTRITASSSTPIVANRWYLVAAVYDGPSRTFTLFVNGSQASPVTGVPTSLTPNAHDMSIGSKESSSASGYDLGFVGVIDEVQTWDRPLSVSEISAYYNLTSSASPIVAWLDMGIRTASGDLADASGMGHSGVATGTTIVEGRSGFARKLAGGSDGIALVGTEPVSFANGATVSLYVLVSAYPSMDTSLVSRRGSLYLNLTSDGRVMWTNDKGSSLVSPSSIGLNRWVRIAATASSSTLTIYVDGLQVAYGPGGVPPTPPTPSPPIVLGYAEGLSHLSGSLDEVLILNAVPQSARTFLDLGARGIQLNPNATDTDGDGLADGQELVVQAFKTAKRYPLPEDSSATARRLDMTGRTWATCPRRSDT